MTRHVTNFLFGYWLLVELKQNKGKNWDTYVSFQCSQLLLFSQPFAFPVKAVILHNKSLLELSSHLLSLLFMVAELRVCLLSQHIYGAWFQRGGEVISDSNNCRSCFLFQSIDLNQTLYFGMPNAQRVEAIISYKAEESFSLLWLIDGSSSRPEQTTLNTKRTLTHRAILMTFPDVMESKVVSGHHFVLRK